jgi:primary-amine oxidase
MHITTIAELAAASKPCALQSLVEPSASLPASQPFLRNLFCPADVPMLMQPDSLVGKRAFFATKHLFVTPHEDGQLFPSGDHVVQSEDCLGLKQWTKEV